MSTNETPVTCRRCHRQLHTAASIAAGIGPRCAAVEAAVDGLNGKQADKALELIADRGVIATGRKGIYRVSATDGEHAYLTAVTGQCTCAWGSRRHSALAKTCYHVAAAKLTARPRIRTAA